MRQAFHLILFHLLRFGVAVIRRRGRRQLTQRHGIPSGKADDVLKAILYRKLVESKPPSKEERTNHDH